MFMLDLLTIKVTSLPDGVAYYANTPDDILNQMNINSWDRAKSVLHFKKDMAFRVEMMGTHLVFWDASSFLYALQEAGFCEIELNWSENNEKKN